MHTSNDVKYIFHIAAWNPKSETAPINKVVTLLKAANLPANISIIRELSNLSSIINFESQTKMFSFLSNTTLWIEIDKGVPVFFPLPIIILIVDLSSSPNGK